jgi:hypothetical protein
MAATRPGHAARSDLSGRAAALFVLNRLYSPLESALETRRGNPLAVPARCGHTDLLGPSHSACFPRFGTDDSSPPTSRRWLATGSAHKAWAPSRAVHRVAAPAGEVAAERREVGKLVSVDLLPFDEARRRCAP